MFNYLIIHVSLKNFLFLLFFEYTKFNLCLAIINVIKITNVYFNIL